MCKWLVLCLSVWLLAACDAPDYPRDWPAPVAGSFGAGMKGDCPDLTGTYDGVGSELSWLLGSNPDVEKPRPVWQEHRAVVTQADDGSWVRIDFTLNERGLPVYRDRLLGYNLDSNGYDADRGLWLTAGKEYTCRNGWLYSLRYAQGERVKTWQRQSLQLGRNKAGELIAGATISKGLYLSVWAEAQGAHLGNYDDTTWYRWPVRSPAADAQLAAAQSVTLHRYPWVNHGRSIPVRFSSFYVEPLCVRFFYGGYPVKVHGPQVRRSRDDPRPPEQDCPAGWGRFDIGETFRKDLFLPEIVQETSRLEWYVMHAADKTPQVIEIRDVRELPLMPEDARRR